MSTLHANNDGGPAFPVHSNHAFFNGRVVAVHEQGMTLRDWFAGQALAHIPELLSANEKNRSVEMIAAWSYEVADAMLKTRKVKP